MQLATSILSSAVTKCNSLSDNSDSAATPFAPGKKEEVEAPQSPLRKRVLRKKPTKMPVVASVNRRKRASTRSDTDVEMTSDENDEKAAPSLHLGPSQLSKKGFKKRGQQCAKAKNGCHSQKKKSPMYIQLDEKDNNQWKFYFTRTSFRLQNQYYKEKFARYFPKNELPVKVEKETIDAGINSFLQDLLEEKLFKSLDSAVQQRLTNVLILFLFSHRHNKGDELVEKTLQQIRAEHDYADFALIRNVCYKYSKGNLRNFFLNPYTAFLFHQFASSEAATSDFIKGRMDDKETK